MAATIWKGFLTFGLISIPIKLHKAARAEKVSFRQLYRSLPQPPTDQEPSPRPSNVLAFDPRQRKTGAAAARVEEEEETESVPEPVVSRVRQALYAGPEDAQVERSQIVKGYEYEKDQYVVLERDELKSLAPETARNMQISEFVKLADIDPVYFETSYYVSPERGGERPYALLYEALKQVGVVALAEVAMHQREHVVVVRPGPHGLILHTMFYTTEIRSADEFRVDTSKLTPKELELAKTLVQSLASPFEPEKYKNSYREKLEALIQSKIAGRSGVAAVETPAAPAKETVDILKMLQSSLEMTKKPARSEGKAEAAKAKPKKGTSRK